MSEDEFRDDAWIPPTSKKIEPDLSKGVTVRGPREGELFTANPDPASKCPVYVVEDDGKYWLVDRKFLPTFEAKFPGRAKPVTLHTCMNLEGEIFLWPIETESDTAA